MTQTRLSSAFRHVRASGAPGRRLESIIKAGARPFRRRPELRPPPTSLIDYIAADIVNNCNLRCPFCLVDYGQVHNTQLMDAPTFKALVRMAPAVPDGGFWLSCLHEPTLHPRLAEYLSWIPVDQRRKFWFTTNLARPLPDALIEALAHSGLHHINVSLDTFDEQLFAVLRKHGRVAVFRDNLDRLVEAFRRTPGAPPLRYITMAFRSNQHEIPDLVRWMNDVGMAWQIEIRYTFNTLNIAEEFKWAHYLRGDEWDVLRARLEALPYDNYELGEPPPGYDKEDPCLPANWFDTYVAPPNTPVVDPVFTVPLQLRARPNGRLHLLGQEHLFSLNIVDVEDPVRYLDVLCSAATAGGDHPRHSLRWGR
jgi:MoaA/NifB/PqqE/SkfB family radical SAM enzyme